jgi:hypothetical protein
MLSEARKMFTNIGIFEKIDLKKLLPHSEIVRINE